MLRLLLIDETLNEDGVKWTELNCNAPPLFRVAHHQSLNVKKQTSSYDMPYSW
jgi:hypothetical protein